MSSVGVEKLTEKMKKGMSNQDGSSSMVWKIGQVVIGIVSVYAIYLLALLAVRADKLGIDKKLDLNKKQMVSIVDGFAESSEFSFEKGQFNTAIPAAHDYLPIRPSVNLRGGAQFSYSIWLNLGSTDYVRDKVQNKCIFMKGDSEKYSYRIKSDMGTRDVLDNISMCPMMCFGANEMEFNVFFNTFHNIKETFEINKLDSDNSATRHNLMSLYSRKWVMVTIVFEDNIPINDFENGILVKFYLNDMLYHSGRFSSALRQNNGLLYMFPDGAVPNCRIADFVYYNYAITEVDIKKRVDRGPSAKPSVSVARDYISPSWLSDYNRLDIYNT
jgi:hypothetical protein